jgi:type IV pilus assembly protein PilV
VSPELTAPEQDEIIVKKSIKISNIFHSRGITMIEVLVALIILSIGLLGLASLQANSLKYNQSAYMRTQATQYAYDIADRMRANRDVALGGGYDIALADAAPTSTSVVDQDLAAWLGDVATLPNGDASIVRNNQQFTITVQWEDDRTEATQANRVQTFVFVTEL